MARPSDTLDQCLRAHADVWRAPERGDVSPSLLESGAVEEAYTSAGASHRDVRNSLKPKATVLLASSMHYMRPAARHGSHLQEIGEQK